MPPSLEKARTRIDKYEIVARLGSGGMGSVYLAHDPGLGRGVAIKLLRGPVFDEDDELLARFLREARATANLRHQNIVTVYDVGQHEQQPFIAMEYVAGDSMATLVRERRPIPLVTRIDYLEQVCAGLHFAHRAGIVHRDVKPANLMVDTQGVVRILDFGIARLDGSGMTRDGALMGTLNYMSPEQMMGRALDHRSDIFAVGAVAYELIACQQAFPGTLEEGLLDRLPHEPPVPLASLCPGLDAALEAVVMRALEKKPEHRFPDLAEMQAALAAARQAIDVERGRAFVLQTTAPVVVANTLVRGSTPRGDASTIRALLDKASLSLDTGDPASAIAIAEEVISRAPGSVEAHALLLRAHQALSARESHSPRRPWYSTRAAAGAGVGLALAATIVAAWSGLLRIESPPPPAPAVVTSPTVSPPAPVVPPEIAPPEPRARVEPPAPSPSSSTAPAKPAVEKPAAAEPSRPTPTSTAPTSTASSSSSTAAPPAAAPSAIRPEPDPAPAIPGVDAAGVPEPAPPVAPPPVATPSPLERERPGILAALNHYRAAYQSQSVDALRSVYPGLDREKAQAFERGMKDCRAFEVAFGEPDIALNGDNAFVEVQSTYICTPKTRQRPPAEPVKDVFRLRKTATSWIIVGMGAMGGS